MSALCCTSPSGIYKVKPVREKLFPHTVDVRVCGGVCEENELDMLRLS